MGCQRSGTSMVMRVFDLSLKATVFWESDRRAFDQGLLLREETVVKQLIDKSRTELAVFKPMNEMHNALEWLRGFSDLRILWLLRSYKDVVNSSVRKFSSMRESLQRIARDPKTSGWWGGGISEENLDFVRSNYRDTMTLEDAYAIFWVIRNSLYLDLELDKSDQVRVCEYEKLVSNPVAEFQAVFEFCGLKYNSDLVREIFSSSVGKNPAPKLTPKIEEKCIELTERMSNRLATN